MKQFNLIIALISLASLVNAQTTTVSSGNWSDGTVWSTSPTVPGANTNVTLTNPLTLDQNITIGTGDYFFFQNVTDLAGGSAFTLTANTAGGILDIKAGTTTFEGAANFSNSTIIIRNGATLVLGATTIDNGTTVTIEAGGTLIVNGTLLNSNSSGTFTVNGLVQVNGNYDTNNGNLDVSGTGDIITTGTIFNQGSSQVFGSSNDCGAGPCSGRNLCGFTNSIAASQTLCSGSTPAAFTVASNASSPIYSWESSTSSSTSGFALASGTNNAANYTPGALSQTIYYRRKVTSGGCTGISAPLTITIVPSVGGWKGITNDWNTASNWCSNAVPISTTDVAISTGVPNQPQITAASNCHDLIVNPGASVTINGSNTLSVFGNLTNNGTFTTNTSTVTLSGSAQQTVSGNGITFNNLTINNASVSSPQITLNTFTTVQGTLTMTAGDVNLSGYNLTLGLSTGTTGTLSYTSGKLFNGDFTRWVSTPVIPDLDNRGLFPMGTSSKKRPVYISFPVTAPTTLGTIRVGHTEATTTSTVSITDGGSTITRRQDSFWKIAPGNGLAGGTINLRAGGTGFGTVGALSDLRVMLAAAAASGANVTATGSLTDFLAIRTGLNATTLNNNFYIGSINAVQSPLPITLLSFTASRLKNSVSLDWVTASEKDFDYFQIERASEDLVFKTISRVGAQGGVNVKTTYNYEDANPLIGKNYYRLKHVDYDGTYDYSPVVYILWETNTNDITLYPNPITNHEFTLELNKETSSSYTTMKLVSSLGLQIMEQQIMSNKEIISLQKDLKPGVYFLKIIGNGFNRTIKIIIQ